MSLLSSLQKQQKETGRKLETVMITVTGIRPLALDKCPKDKDGNPIAKSQVITKEAGSLFCFESSIVNPQLSYAHGAKAQVTLEEVTYKDKNGKDATIVNVNRVEFLSNDETFRGASLYGVVVNQ